jgi:DNA-binding transcriptional ArsR family regulator
MPTPRIVAAIDGFARDLVTLLEHEVAAESRSLAASAAQDPDEPTSSVVEIHRFAREAWPDDVWPPSDTAAGRTLALLRASAAPLSPREIREQLDIAASAVSHALARLLARGLVIASGPSKYKRTFVANPVVPEPRVEVDPRSEASGAFAIPFGIEHGLAPLADVEKRYILHVLRAMQGNKSRTARALRVDRRTLYRKLEAWEREGSLTPFAEADVDQRSAASDSAKRSAT